MARQRQGKPPGPGGFQASAGGKAGPAAKPPKPAKPAGRKSSGSQAIPDAVAKRMVRRIAVAAGLPSLLGMGVIVASYLLISRGGMFIPPVVTLLGSGAFFLLGVLGLSYGVISASWEDAPGSLFGLEQMGVNVGRIRDSVRAMRQGAGSGGS
jgi:hypothetical protein